MDEDRPTPPDEAAPKPKPRDTAPSWLATIAAFVIRHAYSLVIVALIALLWLFVRYVNRGPNVTPATFDAIAYGMTEKDVERILGDPATGAAQPVEGVKPFGEGGAQTWKEWRHGKARMVICFVNGRVGWKTFSE